MQGIALYIIAAFFACYPNEKLDILDAEKHLQTQLSDTRSNRSNLSRDLRKREIAGSTITDICELVRNPVYVMILVVICSMYFSSTGL
jgi:hypothetical protein